jgi:hypothetical protein
MMKHKTVLMFFLLLLALCSEHSIFAQTQVPQSVNLKDVIITMKQEPVNDGCLNCVPVYSVSISGDGIVTYEGNAAVTVTGKQVYSISVGQVKELVAEFYRIDFFSLSDEYITRDNGDGTHTRVDHAAPATVSITMNGKTKKVYNFFGAPDKLIELQKKIYEISGIARYTKRA